MNADTIVAFFGGTGRNQIASQTLASVTETEFKVNTDDATGAIAVLALPLQTAKLGSGNPIDVEVNASQLSGLGGGVRPWMQAGRPYFNSDSFEGRPFRVSISGVATPASDAGNTLNIILYMGATKAGTAIAQTGAVPEASTVVARDFILQADLIWSASTGKLNGQFWFFLDGTSGTQYTTWAAATESAPAAASDVKFCASATWGNAVGGVVSVKEFSISKL